MCLIWLYEFISESSGTGQPPPSPSASSPWLSWEQEPVDMIAVRGQSARFDCLVDGDYTDLTVQWFQDNQPVIQSDQRRQILANGSLYFDKVKLLPSLLLNIIRTHKPKSSIVLCHGPLVIYYFIFLIFNFLEKVGRLKKNKKEMSWDQRREKKELRIFFLSLFSQNYSTAVVVWPMRWKKKVGWREWGGENCSYGNKNGAWGVPASAWEYWKFRGKRHSHHPLPSSSKSLFLVVGSLLLVKKKK